MKFKIIFIIFFLTSCASNNRSADYLKNVQTFSSKGFALVYDEKDFENKIVSKKIDNSRLLIAHNSLSRNKILVLTNPENNKSIQLPVHKKVRYPAFYNVLITKSVSEELGLNPNFPYLEVYERNKNKSFIAKKAEMFNEEKKVLDKAPITQIKIDNISNKPVVKKKDKKVNKKFSIIVGEFYSKKTAYNLKKNLKSTNISNHVLKVRKLGNNRFELFAGPYSSINTLKNDYFKLNKYGFEYLEIKQNE